MWGRLIAESRQLRQRLLASHSRFPEPDHRHHQYGAEAGSPEDAFAEAIGAAYAVALPGQINIVYEPGNHGLTALEQFSEKKNDGHTLLVLTDRYISALAAGQTEIDVTRDLLPNLLGV